MSEHHNSGFSLIIVKENVCEADDEAICMSFD